MDGSYVYLMSVFNDIEAENVVGILETEGISAKKVSPGEAQLKAAYAGDSENIDIYVSDYNYDRAREVIETEMVRGDF